MTAPLLTQIAGMFSAALGQHEFIEQATLIRSTTGTRSPTSLVDGTNPTTTSYACKGVVSSEKHEKIGETLVEATDVVVCIVGASLPVTPLAKDKITIGGVTRRIVDVDGNPAMWTVLLRG